MCGLLGAVASIKSQPDIIDRMNRSLELLNHRGPNGTGRFVDLEHGVWFGHKRLAVVELSELGHQPMLSVDNSIALVFNGEIYNYKMIRAELKSKGHTFLGNSDTEVVLEAYRRWGIKCFNKFNGAFGLAIFDKVAQKVHFARDIAGEKPFFYTSSGDSLYFASELTALMELSSCDRIIDQQGLLSYMSRGYVLGERTLLRDAKSLQPGHCATFDCISRSFSIASYWSVPSFDNSSANRSELSYEDELLGLLDAAVARQLDCDVPACILLSGGVDSSLLTALAAPRTTQLKTFTVRFPGHPKFDETSMARLVSSHFGTSHTEIDGISIRPETLFEIANRLDTPVNDSSLLPTFLVYGSVSRICKVALGGDGADELFGGYKHYSRMLILDSFVRKFHFQSKRLRLNGLKNIVPSKYRFRNWLECFGLDTSSEIPNIREILTLQESANLLVRGDLDPDSFRMDWHNVASGKGSILRNCCIADFNSYLASSILVKSDRMSMLNSVEARAPFLDKTVVEFAYRNLPDSLRASRNDRKILLKKLCVKLLPTGFDLNRKLGFNLPFGEMIRTGLWREAMFDVLQEENGIIDRMQAGKMLENHMLGENYADQLFGLFMLSIWIKNNKVHVA